MIKELESWLLTLIKIEETQHLRNILNKVEDLNNYRKETIELKYAFDHSD